MTENKRTWSDQQVGNLSENARNRVSKACKDLGRENGGSEFLNNPKHFLPILLFFGYFIKKRNTY